MKPLSSSFAEGFWCQVPGVSFREERLTTKKIKYTKSREIEDLSFLMKSYCRRGQGIGKELKI
jgi:hypothetical protein